VSNSNKTQMDIAKEAAELALRTLYPQDLVGVVAFDTTAKWIVPLEENSNPEATAKLIRSLEPGGGTDIYAGLIAAYEELASSKGRVQDKGIKHVIVVSDGQSPGNFQQLVTDMRRAGITVSTVGVGDGHDGSLLGQIAQLGDGNYYPVNDPNNLPQVFIKEARTIRKNLIKETDFVPILVNTGSPITAGMTATPQLQGLVLTGPRLDRRAETPLLGPESEPLFAHWQVGLGRAAAFTSDATNRWAANWLTWNGYADFWARTVRYIARPSATRDADLGVSLEDNQLRIRLDATALNADGNDSSTTAAGFGDNLVVRGGVLAPDGSIMPVTLSQTGPGLYEANLPASQAGNYITNLYLDSPDGERRSVFGGATRPPGEELRRFSPDLGLLKQVAQETGGRLLLPHDPAANGLFARTTEFRSISSRPLRWDILPWLLLLVLLDVANRRVAWDARASVHWVKQRFTERRDEQQAAETLSALKRRKAISPVAVSDGDQSAVPVASTVLTNRKFEAAPDAVAQPDFATAVGGATRKPVLARTNDADKADTQDAPTTNRLLAAKRRARQEQEEG
jgi:Mg-chelatase subunit ChlD